jgi:hypothetical protein
VDEKSKGQERLRHGHSATSIFDQLSETRVQEKLAVFFGETAQRHLALDPNISVVGYEGHSEQPKLSSRVLMETRQRHRKRA